jgi:hypothetical protein
MNYERMGIAVAMIVLVGVLGVAAVGSGEFDIGIDKKYVIPNITSSTNTDNSEGYNGFYDYCYKMGLDC